MMLYELDDIEKRALVMEIKPEKTWSKEFPQVEQEAYFWLRWPAGCQEPVRVLRSGEVFGTDSARNLAGHIANHKCEWLGPITPADTDQIFSLIARIESQAEDIRFLGDRLEVQADVMSKVVAERNQLRDAIEVGLVAMELLRSWIGPPPTGPYDFDSLREDGWKSSTAAMKQMRDSLSPKGEQK